MIDGSGRGWNVEIAPDLTQQLVAVHDPLVPLSQALSTPNSRCVRWTSRLPVTARRALKSMVTAPSTQAIDSTAASPKHGLDACEQLVEIERLGEIVVGAEFQPAQLVGFCARADRITTGVRPPCRSTPHKSNPLRSGSIRSSRTRSG